MDDFAVARLRMVDSQLRTENVTDYDVLSVMGRVPREDFVPAQQRGLAYLDFDIPVKQGGTGPQRYLMEASPFARLLQLAEIDKDDLVLDVGCATGYSTAVLSGLANFVVALESDEALAAAARKNLDTLGVDNVKVVVGPLESGCAPEGPFDVIVVEGSVEVLPATLLSQLKNGGRLVAVVGNGRAATATLYSKNENQVGRRSAFNADVRPLPGFRKPAVFVF